MVADLSSVTKAAELLHVAQPSISQSIARLEKELGVRLFDRTGKSVQINMHGKILYEGARSVLSTLDQTLKNIELFKTTSVTPLVIQIWPKSHICSTLMLSFAEKYSFIEYQLVQQDSSLCTPDVSLFVAGASPPEDRPSKVLLQENIRLVVPYTHPLAQYDSMPLNYAKDADFVMLSKEVPFRNIVENYCHIAGFTPKVVFESDYSGTLVRMLRLGQYAGFLTEYMLKTYKNETEQLKIIRITSPVCVRTINLAIREGMESSPSATCFASFAQQYFENLSLGITVHPRM